MLQSHWLKVNLLRLFVKLFMIRWLQREIGRNLQQKVLGRLNLLCVSYESRFRTNILHKRLLINYFEDRIAQFNCIVVKKGIVYNILILMKDN